MDETNNDAGLGHNDRAAVRALEGIREYQAGVTKEQAGRDDAIAGIIKYGAGLIEGRGQLNDKAFGEWVRAQGLDATPPFNERQERAAAQQIAAISSDGTTTVTSFEGCPHSRPTNIMRWWRAKRPKPAPEPHAPATEAVREATPVAHTAPKSAAAQPVRSAPAPASDRVQKAAENAEIATLKRELSEARDKLAAVSGSIPWPPDSVKAVAKIMAKTPRAASLVVNALVPLLQGTDSPVQFTPAQQKDIDATIKQYQKNSNAAFWATVDKEASKLVAAQVEKLAPGLLAREKEAQEAKNRAYRQEQHYRDLCAKAAIFNETEFANIRNCLHPDNSASDDKRTAAFAAFNAQKARLVAGPPRVRVSHGISIKPRNPPPPRP
jgi:nitroreductase